MKKDEREIRMDGGKLVIQKVQRINKEEVSSFKKGIESERHLVHITHWCRCVDV